MTTAVSESSSPPPPSNAAPDGFEWLAPPSNPAATHYDRSTIRLVKAGQPIARMTTDSDPAPFLGHNARLAPDRRTLIATVDGRAIVRDGRVCVETVLEIDANVDFSVGNIDFPGDVIVHGSILDLFKVRSAGAIFVDGDVEAADVRAAANLSVAGAIVGKDRGACTVGGTLHARYVTNARIDAGIDVVCQTAIANSVVVAAGRVDVSQGAVIAGTITANGGLVCKDLGNAAGVITVAEVGVDEAFRRSLPEAMAHVAAHRARAEKIEQTVRPLLEHQKSLNPEQKEKATELLFEARQMRAEGDRLASDLRVRHERFLAASKPEVVVHGMIHPGVVIRFPGLQTTIDSTFEGPLRICLKKTRGEVEVTLIDLQTGARQVLPAESIEDPVAAAMASL